MIIGGLVMLKHGIVVYSRLVGKTAHCVFIAGLVATYFHDWFVARCVGWMLTPDLLLLWLGVCITLCALVFYVSDAIRKGKGNHLTGRRAFWGMGGCPSPLFCRQDGLPAR